MQLIACYFHYLLVRCTTIVMLYSGVLHIIFKQYMYSTVLTKQNAWVETQQQTNGNVITIDGQKPMLDNSIEKDQIA